MDIVRLFPAQGAWSEKEHLALPGNHLVEVSEGFLDVLPVPTDGHQRLVAYLYRALVEYLAGRPVGRVIVAPLRVRFREGTDREPDLVLMSEDHAGRRRDDYWDVTDLVMEVVSPDDSSRDTRRKRREYPQAGIPEYWLVDPMEQTDTVLALDEAGAP